MGNTADAEFSTMDSLYPLPDDVAFIDYAKNTYKALPQLLVKNGYKTYSMHGDVPTGEVVPFWLHVCNVPDDPVNTSAIGKSADVNEVVFTAGMQLDAVFKYT